MRAAFFDIDGTLTNERAWKGMLFYFQKHNLRRGTHLAYITLHYPLYFLRRLNLITEGAFRTPWSAHLSWYLRGFTLRQANELWEWTVGGFLSQHWRLDTKEILEEHKRSGDLVVLVSSGPQPMVDRIVQELGAHYGIGTRFEIQEGRYTGRSLKPVCIDQYKASMTRELLESQGLKVDLQASFAYADSLADLSLLEMTGNPVAVYPEAGLRSIAGSRQWRIFPS
jgi:HAD superfamily hydrolase (TIGR01490 family)